MPIAIVPVVALLLLWNYRLETIEDLTRYPWSLDLQTMHYTADIPYMTAEEKTRLVGEIMKIAGDRQVTVQTEPAADAFLLLPYSSDRLNYIYPLFQQRTPDICVIHYSRYLPAWWKFNDHVLSRAGITRDSSSYITMQRSGTEQWYIVPISPSLRKGPG